MTMFVQNNQNQIHQPNDNSIVNNINQFGFDFYREITKEKSKENYIIASLGSFISLFSAQIGSRNSTYEQLKAVTKISSAHDEQQLTTLVRHITQTKVVSIASNIFINKNYSISSEYIDHMNEVFQETPVILNFEKKECSALEINEWVSDKTHGQIKNAITPEMLNEHTCALFVNSICFRALWKDPFIYYGSNRFFLEENICIEAPFIWREDVYDFFQEEKFKVLNLPYQQDLSMLLILPDMGRSIEDVLEHLTLKNLKGWLSPHPKTVKVILPKFEFENSISIRKHFENMGITNAFSVTDADFSGIGNQPDIYLQDVIQKTHIKVDEYGTEIGSFTEGFTIIKGGEVKKFNANRPFLLLIVEKQTQTLLFTGQVTNPKNNSIDKYHYIDISRRREDLCEFQLFITNNCTLDHWLPMNIYDGGLSRYYRNDNKAKITLGMLYFPKSPGQFSDPKMAFDEASNKLIFERVKEYLEINKERFYWWNGVFEIGFKLAPRKFLGGYRYNLKNEIDIKKADLFLLCLKNAASLFLN